MNWFSQIIIQKIIHDNEGQGYSQNVKLTSLGKALTKVGVFRPQ